MSEARYRIGPFALTADGWPSAWRSYADQMFHTDDDAGRALLRVRSDSALAPSEPGSPLTVTRDTQTRFDVRGPAGLRAHFDVDTGVIVVGSLDEEPHLHLGNALRAAVSVMLPLKRDGVLLHSAGAVLDDCGLVLAGLSGAGKSTLTRGWSQARALSDDVNVVVGCSDRPMLLASPFFGAQGRRGTNVDAPLGAIGLLKRATAGTWLSTCSPSFAARTLLRHVVSFTSDPVVMARSLVVVSELLARVAVVEVARSRAESADEVAGALRRMGTRMGPAGLLSSNVSMWAASSDRPQVVG